MHHSTANGPTALARSVACWPYVAAHLAVLGTLVALVVAALHATGGHLVYSQDDPYIHLAMSEEIARGGYGVNTGEWASASSSILFPVLLAPAAGFAWHELVPLGINVVALLLTVHVFWRYLQHLGFQPGRSGQWFCGLVVASCVIGLNVVSLVLSGLEHNLHVLATLAVLYGVVVFLESGVVRWWLVLGILLGPLVRYEATAVSLAAVGVLCLGHRARLAAVLAAIVFASLACFSWLLVAHGLAALPSSVLVKLQVGGHLDEPVQLLVNLLRRVNWSIDGQEREGILLGGACVAAAIALALSWRGGARARILFLSFYVATIVAHLAVGNYGWLHRYEIYVVVFAAAGALHVWRDAIVGLLRERRTVLAAGVVVLLVGFVGGPYLLALEDVPRSCRNTYEQQFQMHRFVREFHQGPVAVNDLGLVSYRNPHYVLDLWGLGSERVRSLAQDGLAPAEVEALVKERGIGLAMVYEGPLADSLPADWVCVARMRVSGPRVVLRVNHVEFFATSAEAAATVRQQLHAFQPTLPPGVHLEIFDPMRH